MIFVLYLIFGQLESTKHPLRGCVCVGGGGGEEGGGGVNHIWLITYCILRKGRYLEPEV